MDTSGYTQMFLAESREHLQELNLAVIRVEERPDDTSTIDEIFRVAHSFKGMSAAMGFDAVAALTHKMEDVFALLKQRRGGLSRDAVDVLLECLDAIAGAVDAIEETGKDQLDPAELIARLEGLVRTDDEEPEVEAAAVAAPLADHDGLHIQATLAADTAMPSVRAFMVFAALRDHGKLVASVPAVADIDGFDGHELQAWVETDYDDEVVLAAVREIADVDSAVVPGTAAPATKESAPPAHHVRSTSTTVRVDAERLDQLMHFMGELVVHRTKVESLAAAAGVPGLVGAMQDLTRSSQALQAMVMQVRMIPCEAVLLRFPRLVRDLSSKLGKKIELELVGGDTELDRTVVDALGDPLVHLVRNALDHGLEPPDERLAAGKGETGTIVIAARHAAGNVVIEVSDDGRGIDPQKVGEIAIARGVLAPEQAEGLDAARAAELLFAPGFSTATETSDISGRGVGMDAVRATIRGLGGEVSLTSELGKGTRAEIRLPLTLAIMAALLVEAGGLPYAIQLDRVETILRLADHPVRSIAGRRVLMFRDSAMPLIEATEALGMGTRDEGGRHAVVVRTRDGNIGLVVSKLVGQRELVTRALPPQLRDTTAVSGGAVLSNGDIALIVDCDALAAVESTSPPAAALSLNGKEPA